MRYLGDAVGIMGGNAERSTCDRERKTYDGGILDMLESTEIWD